MATCPECGADWPDGTDACTLCGADLTAADTASTQVDHSATTSQVEQSTSTSRVDRSPDSDGTDQRAVSIMNADYDPEEEREQFEQRYAIDIGDRTVGEFLEHLDQQDYSLTAWFWAIIVAELCGVGLFVFTQFGIDGWDILPVFFAASAFLALSILADTRAVGQFRTWSKTRWTYVLVSAIPFWGQIAGVLYLLLRRFMRQETQEQRRRLLEAGFDIDFKPRDS